MPVINRYNQGRAVVRSETPDRRDETVQLFKPLGRV